MGSRRREATFGDVLVALGEHPAHDVDGGLALVLDHLVEVTRSRSAFVVLAVRVPAGEADALGGLRPRRVIHRGTSPEHLALIRSYFGQAHKALADPHAQAMAHGAGRHRAALRADLVADQTWQRSEQVQELLPLLDVRDRLMGACAVGPDTEVFYGCNRGRGDGAYRARERLRMLETMRHLAWFHRRLAWSHGLLTATRALAPRERVIAGHLLAGHREKTVAAALGLTENATHQYVVRLYRRLGVRSRAELMARFANNGREVLPPSSPALASYTIAQRAVRAVPPSSDGGARPTWHAARARPR